MPMPDGATTVFGYVAQFRPEKGHHRLMDALERIRADGWRIDLAGAGPLRPAIEARVAAAGLTGTVRFVGEIADPRAFWRDRHVALLFSDSEGSPNALIEAAFAGRPVIATAVGGTPETVGDEGAILIGLNDPGDAIRAMTELLTIPSVASRWETPSGGMSQRASRWRRWFRPTSQRSTSSHRGVPDGGDTHFAAAPSARHDGRSRSWPARDVRVGGRPRRRIECDARADGSSCRRLRVTTDRVARSGSDLGDAADADVWTGRLVVRCAAAVRGACDRQQPYDGL